MRTKTLLIAAAALAAAITSSNAQTTVYSQNIVGYVNLVLPASSYSMVVNPLANSNTTQNAEVVLPCLQSGDSVYTWTGTTFNIYQYLAPATWIEPDGTIGTAPNLSMSQGFFYQTGSGSQETNTFTGTVVLTNSVSLPASSYNMVGSVSPIGVNAEDPNLGLPLNSGDSIYEFANGTYNIYQYLAPATWIEPDGTIGTAPTVGVGQGFFYLTGSGTAETWNQSTTVQ